MPTENKIAPAVVTDTPVSVLNLITRSPVHCPCCGYSLHDCAVVLLSPTSPSFMGDITIGAVCASCYRTNYLGCCFVVSLLFHPIFATHTDTIHGVRFFSPHDPALLGYSASDVYDHLMNCRELPTIPHLDLAAPITRRPKEPTLFDPPSNPLTDTLEAYDPPCPTDVL